MRGVSVEMERPVMNTSGQKRAVRTAHRAPRDVPVILSRRPISDDNSHANQGPSNSADWCWKSTSIGVMVKKLRHSGHALSLNHGTSTAPTSERSKRIQALLGSSILADDNLAAES
ncbi:hypothetical protein CORC01_07039 [Colletotrichum orchidophilum]|uniref:Uncharacterized protein n=1 Tax=Colletotrichum orchidophilum TaxID=1209926 RepID=A0A1G4B8B8_9PEZI|nr:uncharacterized protein CORC01_07039 [Colletotrichum orchidophilum]OHE97624.1 hypothetical protein CORC01_07039 [Colletotrichum orchidophilum]